MVGEWMEHLHRWLVFNEGSLNARTLWMTVVFACKVGQIKFSTWLEIRGSRDQGVVGRRLKNQKIAEAVGFYFIAFVYSYSLASTTYGILPADVWLRSIFRLITNGSFLVIIVAGELFLREFRKYDVIVFETPKDKNLPQASKRSSNAHV